ncbi:hypothetical protein AAOGI_25310 [Agarivorans albus]
MQQLANGVEILSEHSVVTIAKQFSESQFLASAQQFVKQQQWQQVFVEQGADWQVLGFYIEQQLWWFRYDALSQGAWFECANSEHFHTSSAPLLAALNHANFD